MSLFPDSKSSHACFMAAATVVEIELLLGLTNPRSSLHGDVNGMSVLHADMFYCSSSLS